MNSIDLKDNFTVFCDFDGTITKEDTIDKLLQMYAEPEWLEIEQLWDEGKIGSKECLERQVGCIKELSKQQLNDFINNIEIDEHFLNFYNLVKNQCNVDFYIVSDGFDIFIKGTLAKYNLQEIKIFSNSLCHDDNKLIPSFPFYREGNCISGSGLCKCQVLKDMENGRKIFYIGDGRSDMCASKHADVLFAKKKLIDYCKSNNLKCIPFTNFNEIVEIVGNMVKEEILVKN